jgi:hypothetical protein
MLQPLPVRSCFQNLNVSCSWDARRPPRSWFACSRVCQCPTKSNQAAPVAVDSSLSLQLPTRESTHGQWSHQQSEAQGQWSISSPNQQPTGAQPRRELQRNTCLRSPGSPRQAPNRLSPYTIPLDLPTDLSLPSHGKKQLGLNAAPTPLGVLASQLSCAARAQDAPHGFHM